MRDDQSRAAEPFERLVTHEVPSEGVQLSALRQNLEHGLRQRRQDVGHQPRGGIRTWFGEGGGTIVTGLAGQRVRGEVHERRPATSEGVDSGRRLGVADPILVGEHAGQGVWGEGRGRRGLARRPALSACFEHSASSGSREVTVTGMPSGSRPIFLSTSTRSPAETSCRSSTRRALGSQGTDGEHLGGGAAYTAVRQVGLGTSGLAVSRGCHDENTARPSTSHTSSWQTRSALCER